jgi:hypothetical protein
VTLKRLSILLAVVVCVATAGGADVASQGDSPAATVLPSGTDVIARHVAALGGRAAFKAVTSFQARGRFELRDAGVAGDVELYAARPNRLRLRVSVPAIGAIEQGYDGVVGWTLSPISGPALLAGRELAEAAEDAWFDHTLYEADHVTAFVPVAFDVFDGKPVVKVRVTLQSGTEQTEYFDRTDGMQIGSEAVRATPQGLVPTVSILREFRRFGSILQPTVLVQRALGVEQVITIASLELGGVPASAFDRPPSIVALLRP